MSMSSIRPYLAAAVLLTVLIAGCTQNTGNTPPDSSEPADTVEPESGTVTIEITDSGFTPSSVTVEQGTTVIWENTGSREVWPASNRHPSHTNYAGGDYDRSGSYAQSQACTGEGEQKGDAFDACRRLGPGESYEFTFEHTGEWGYHDHLNPGVQGTVTVVE